MSVGSVKILLLIGLSKYTAGGLIALPMALIAFNLHKKFVFKKS
jgi:hypothetical protein